MVILGLVAKEKIGTLATPNPYIAYLNPAWAGNHIVECIIYISDWDLDDYEETRIFSSEEEATKILEKEIFG